PGSASELLEMAELCPLNAIQRARLARLRAQILFARRRGSDAPSLLLDAARQLEPLDAALARETYLEALAAAIFAGRLRRGCGVLEVAEAARTACSGEPATRATDLLLNALATRFTEGYTESAALLRRALVAFGSEDSSVEDATRWLWLACRVAPDLWDDELWHLLATRQMRLANDAGALTVLVLAATYRAGVHVHAGEFAAAETLIHQADVIADDADIASPSYTALMLVAWRGREEEALKEIEAGVRDATERGEGRAVALAAYASAVLYNGLGFYELALASAQRACEYDDLGLLGWALVELIEAGARAGARDPAAAGLRSLEERTRAVGTDWALGVEARSRALLTEGPATESLYREAIERLARGRITVHLARARLLYGEWLRREHRRVEAREQLRSAHGMFASMGAEAFAERARRELWATGEVVRKREVDSSDSLTAQEAQVAFLVAEGYTNREIGGRLFISPRTVEYHLRKVFTKLDISSRREIRAALSA
ncbi:MAG TPA: LuxR C-terminal-related transcriptional regulator, partial [Acidimicrobiia bacterium]